ncbi:MAG TPA: DUF5658 family protein [Balneolales bacterium]|nr:DUF5658 family protein [Balneolales bacterium]
MEMTDQNTIILSNRSGKDRRTKSSFNIRSFLFGGKRENIRRQEDTKRIFYVDHYSPWLFIIIVSILILCVVDAFLTLFLLNHGAYETNPVMAFFLKFGPLTFFISKYLLTTIPVICLLMFRNTVVGVIKLSARSLLYVIVVVYLAVVGWELYLISNVAYSPDLKSSPKIFTDSQMICRMDTPNRHSVSDLKIS